MNREPAPPLSPAGDPVATAARKLSETDEQAIAKLADIAQELGPMAFTSLVAEALQIHSGVGQKTQDGSRKRTPGGVLFQLAKERGLAAKRRVTVCVDFNVEDTERSIEALLTRLSGVWLTATQRESVVLDFSQCQFIGPTGVVVIGAAFLDMRRRGASVRFVPPAHGQLRAYCQWAGLLQLTGTGEGPTDHPESVTIGIRVFKTYDLSGIDAVVRLVNKFIPMSADTESVLRLCISELIQNILDHSESKIGGLLSARAFRERHEVRFAIMDAGVGIQGTMRRRYPQIKDDASCLLAAFDERKSAKTFARNQGLGLAHLNDIVARNGGGLTLISGGATATRHGTVPLRAQLVGNRLPGTLASVTFRIDNALYGDGSAPAGEIEL